MIKLANNFPQEYPGLQLMTGSGTDLHISDGNHITLPSRRKESDENEFSRLDVIFVEAPLAQRPGKLDQLANMAMAPLLVISIYTILFGQKIFQVVGLHDSHLVYDLAEEYDAKIVEVDLNVFDVITEYRLLWMLVHHGILILAIFAIPKLIDTFQWMPTTVVVTSAILSAGFLTFGAFATGTMPARDSQMAYDVEEYSEEYSIDDALLVIGALHLPGVRKRLKDSKQVQIV